MCAARIVCLVFLLVLGCDSASWQPASSMNTDREDHTATLLPDGTVLTTGGCTYSYYVFVVLASSEFFNETNNEWTMAGDMHSGRAGHRAALLSNGHVLVAGGYSGDDLNTAELYDPSSRQWTFTGPMAFQRRDAALTLLSDGDVLVAGGSVATYYDTTRFWSSSEIYDTSAGVWRATGDMNFARSSHTATLLSDGRVLAAGGDSVDGYQASTETYDPSSGGWKLAGYMSSVHAFHTATLLVNGKVLIAGGAVPMNQYESSSSAELFDPSSELWAVTGSMNFGRYYHAATIFPSGNVLVTGGGNNPTSAEIYDCSKGTWSFTSGMLDAAASHTSTLLPSGYVVVAGGYLYFKEIVSGLTATYSDCSQVGCNNHGDCSSGTCTCENGWFGTLCLSKETEYDSGPGNLIWLVLLVIPVIAVLVGVVIYIVVRKRRAQKVGPQDHGSFALMKEENEQVY